MSNDMYIPGVMAIALTIWEAKDNARTQLHGSLDEEDLAGILLGICDRLCLTEPQQADLYARLTEGVLTDQAASFSGLQGVISKAIRDNRDTRDWRTYG
jgi:hypothetical protein